VTSFEGDENCGQGGRDKYRVSLEGHEREDARMFAKVTPWVGIITSGKQGPDSQKGRDGLKRNFKKMKGVR